jgi:hypothetical protein
MTDRTVHGAQSSAAESGAVVDTGWVWPDVAPDASGTLRLPLTHGLEAIIDAADAHLAARQWRAMPRADGNGFYAIGRWRGRPWRLHRAVLGVSGDALVDHINGDTLDCRRSNLRVATSAQNAWNQRRRSTNSSGFKGVDLDRRRGKWRARVRVGDGRRIALGYFESAEAAARAYDAAAAIHHGPYARPNFR